MHKIFFSAVLLLSLVGVLGFSQSFYPLGLNLQEAFTDFGVPQEVLSLRGGEEPQDDVVFRYSGGVWLFWYRNRVWQTRFDDSYEGSFRGIAHGASRGEVTAALGRPLHAEEDWVLYHFAGPGFPVRLRLFFSDRGLYDAYLYRGDY